MDVASLGMITQVNALTVVSHNVLGTRVMIGPSTHKVLHSGDSKERPHQLEQAHHFSLIVKES